MADNNNKNMAESAWEQVKNGADAIGDATKQAVQSGMDAVKSGARKVKNKVD